VNAARTPRTGRRPGRHDTRAEILAAARHCFAATGYDRTTIRQIAAGAGVDAALVVRRFGSKLDLFLAVVGVPGGVQSVVAGDGAGLGARVVQTFVELWDNAPLRGGSFTGLMRLATGDDAAATRLRGYLRDNLAATLGQALDIDDAERRVALVGSQLLGLGIARYVLRLEPLASASPESVAAELGWAVQHILDVGSPP
jgi:AcrR family transcriptional regulator